MLATPQKILLIFKTIHVILILQVFWSGPYFPDMTAAHHGVSLRIPEARGPIYLLFGVDVSRLLTPVGNQNPSGTCFLMSAKLHN